MKTFKLLFLIAALGLTACGEKYVGTFNVSESFQVNQGDTSVYVPESDYQAVITVKAGDENTKMKVELENPNTEINFDFKIPNVYLPQNGEEAIEVPGQAIGQDFDIVGFNRSTVRDSDIIRDRQRCEYRVRSCRTVVGRDGRAVRVCNDHIRYGYESVEYFTRTHRKHIRLSIRKKHDVVPVPIFVGQFNSENTWHERIYTYRSRCI